MAKVNIKSEKITPFGGIYYASKAFYALSLDKVINGPLGVRSSTYNGYQWDEIMSAMSDVFLCDGDCVEDVNRSECHMRESPNMPYMKFLSVRSDVCRRLLSDSNSRWTPLPLAM